MQHHCFQSINSTYNGHKVTDENTHLVFKNLMVHLSTTPGALKINLQQKQQKQRKLQGFSNVPQTFPKKKNRKDFVVI